MIHCQISFPNPLTHLLHIELKFQLDNQGAVDLILPAWRPGRYELAPFSENIMDFTAFDQETEVLDWEKTRPNRWTIHTSGVKELTVRYKYYANKMDAGNSVLDDNQIYINFINCIFYIKNLLNSKIQLNIDIPRHYKSCVSLLEKSPTRFLAQNYHELVDTPLLASPSLKLLNYTVDDYLFTIAILGGSPLSEGELIDDFKKFSLCQIKTMGGFPTKQYDFLIQSLDYPHYHGVEHQNSTVLVLGPNDDKHRSMYYEKLMGVASHELFHTWNVTRIRPKEMSPYHFDTETMTSTGFVTEGFTTYFGDLFLAQSGVFNHVAYFKELNTLLKRHFENDGRHKSSMIQSSQNLWVDGYKNLFPSKKVSIYVKGALCSLILDLNIRKYSDNKYTLIDVLKKLYQDHTHDKGGYTQYDVYDILIATGGTEIRGLIPVLYESTTSLDTYLSEALAFVGLSLKPTLHPDNCTRILGIKMQGRIIAEIAAGSHSEEHLSVGDEILKIDGADFSDIKMKLKEENLVEIKRGARVLEISIPAVNQTYFGSYEIYPIKEISDVQKQNLCHWLGNNQE